MRYISTRGGDSATFTEAVIKGIADDGGLFVPDSMPDISSRMQQWRGLSYTELACDFLSIFTPDIPIDELRSCVERAYSTFPDAGNPATLVKLSKNLHVLELFHGPTLAFKDFALQLLGQLYGRYTRSSGRQINILGATSGDTGSAAIHGMLQQQGSHSFILYPEGGIAELQERQIACTGSPFVHPFAIQGSFDEAQSIVKQIFGDRTFAAEHSLTAVNSINIARILAQCIYYLDTVLKLGADSDQPLEFVVPTGNFGNILAGWMLSHMGIEGLRFCVATNANSAVSYFFRSGVYMPGAVVPTPAPSMDIQRASNLERWLWWHLNCDNDRICKLMANLQLNNRFELNEIPSFRDIIRPIPCSNQKIKMWIERTWRDYHYMIDPHTACAFEGVRMYNRTVVVATAHPAKFPEIITSQTGQSPKHESLETLKNRKVEKLVMPANTRAIKAEIARILNNDLPEKK